LLYSLYRGGTDGYNKGDTEAVENNPMANDVFVHIPYSELFSYLPQVKKERVNIEIYFSADNLDHYLEKDIETVISVLRDKKLKCTLHGPYQDLSPGSPDPKIREVTFKRFLQTIELADRLKPELVVFHPGFDHRRFQGVIDQWFTHSLDTWNRVLRYSEEVEVPLALENVFEFAPDHLLQLVSNIGSPKLGLCFDTGHYNVFAKRPLSRWIEMFRPFLMEVHLHDNHGKLDEHLALEEGNFPFGEFFELLRRSESSPIFTIEAHNEKAVRRSLASLGKYLK